MAQRWSSVAGTVLRTSGNVLCRTGAALILLSAGGASRAGAQAAPEAGRLFAAVEIVRGSVGGNTVGAYGLFARKDPDTAWSQLSKGNVICFGMGLFDNGRTRRHYIAGGNGVHRSTDSGKSWRVVTSWTTEEILSLAPDPVDSAVIYAATPFGVFKTSDDGATWIRMMKGIPTGFVEQVIVDHGDRRTLYATGERDLYKSTDGAETWSPMQSGCREVLAVMQHPADRGLLLIAGEDQGVRRTTDGGKSWMTARGLDAATLYTFRASASDGALYAGGWQTGLWRSLDTGATWQQVWKAPGVEAILSIFVYPDDPRHIVVGTVARGVFESADNGATWRQAGLEGGHVIQLEMFP